MVGSELLELVMVLVPLLQLLGFACALAKGLAGC